MGKNIIYVSCGNTLDRCRGKELVGPTNDEMLCLSLYEGVPQPNVIGCGEAQLSNQSLITMCNLTKNQQTGKDCIDIKMIISRYALANPHDPTDCEEFCKCSCSYIQKYRVLAADGMTPEYIRGQVMDHKTFDPKSFINNLFNAEDKFYPVLRTIVQSSNKWSDEQFSEWCDNIRKEYLKQNEIFE